MKIKLAAILALTAMPAALGAQQVNLRSPDEFISVDGEITGYNGVMLRVQTLVGEVSVPASEVICYGEACLDVLADNSFGLTAEALAGVVATPVSAAPEIATLGGDLSIAFASPTQSAFFGSFAQTVADATINGTTVSFADGTTLTTTDTLQEADIAVQTVGLQGTDDTAFSGPSGWSASGEDLTHQMTGLGAFVVQASPSTGIDSISTLDLARVFAGEVTNWSQIGGADVPVLGLRLPDNAPAFRELLTTVMEPAGLQMSSTVLAMGDDTGIAASVNQFPGSIALVNAAAANPDLTIPVAGSCGISVSPSPFNIISGDYPLVRPVMATYAGAVPQSVTDLFDAAASNESQDLAQTLGLADFGATRQDAALKNARLGGLLDAELDDVQRAAAAEMFQALFSAERLSTTFYGGAVSGPEAAWNRAMMVNLADALASPENANREVVFVGVGASEAGSQDALSISAQAASEMRAAFQTFAGSAIADAGVTVSSFGFGDVAASTCIDSQVSDSAAAHVEVWIR